MNADVIKDFLISLGFQVDESGAKKFDATIANTSLQAVKLGVAVEAAALSVVAFTAKIASGLDNLYWMSQRTGATVAGIQQIGYAVSQLGGTVDGARSSLEGLAQFVRNNPGAEGFLNRLGVQTRDAKGNMRDMASVFTSVGQRLSQMPYYRANQYAQMLGIDENTLMAMRRGVGQFSAQYTQMAKAIGYNADVAAVSSNRFMTSLRDFGQMAGMARDKIGSDLAGGLAGSIDTLRRQSIDNFPKIENALTGGIKLILWLADTIGTVVFRLIEAAGDIHDWWGSLDKDTRGLIEIFGGLMIAWQLLNSAFLTSPIGIISTLGLAIIALYDDYKTWKEGGKSLIDWKKWQPDIDSALKAIQDLRSSVKDAGAQLAHLLNINLSNWTLKGDIASITKQFGELGKMMSTVGDLLSAINEGRWRDAASLGKSLLQQGKENKDALPAVSSSADSAADSLREKTGFDPRVVGRTIRGWLGLSPVAEPAGKVNSQLEELNKTQSGASHDAAKGREEDKAVQNRSVTLLQAIAEALAPPARANEVSPSVPGISAGDAAQHPQATKEGAALLGWMQPAFQKLEQLYRLPEGLLRSVAITESAGNPNAISRAGAQGLFQIMPGTGRDLGLRGNDAFDPMKAAGAAAKYLSQLLKANDGDLTKALASYNWGLGNVRKYGMGLMPQETRNYVPRVMSNMPASSASLHQETNIHIHGVTDPREAGNVVADKQNQVSARATQQLLRGNS
ncbi:lytic transglycosylase domain-containing protein [Pantoea agglomerans]|uniref:lytic transglycosylase domain-containing protein n=1 Tax=Enterobacter agglomerans TaxID=549 RepID=UPI000F5D759F|nr:lytic transglycosylase domain-containing protein [Pantoea agglomerans]AZI51979.1 lytic transglycosylase domain-containing protein [Pantoea agglomerans]